MLSVDMVGYGATPISVFLDGTDPLAAEVLRGAGGGTLSRRGDISDHEGFARRGTPSALLWRPDNPGYHGPGDTVVFDDRLAASLQTARAFVEAAASPFTTGRGMAHHLAIDLLARRPDLAGAAAFAATPPGQAGAAMLRSDEWASGVAPLARVYLAAFGRHPDLEGLVFWSGAFRSGTSLQTVAAAFVSSAEFRARYGTVDNRGFVRLLYRNVLGRTADSGGESYWTGQLDDGRMTRAGVVVAFSESAEHRARTAGDLPIALAYAGMLRRPVDASGLAHWRGRPLEELVGGLAGSPKFRARLG
jgi:hypothetical protein